MVSIEKWNLKGAGGTQVHESHYRLMINFEKMHDRINDEERKALVSSLIKEVQISIADGLENSLPLSPSRT